MRYLDATEKFQMAFNEQGDRLVGCVTFWRTGNRLCLDTLRQVGMCMIRRQALLRVHIHDPLHSAEGARFVDIENISPNSIPVLQDDSHDWRTVYHHQFHTLFDTTTGPLWRLVFMPNAYSTHKELDENSSKPAELNHMSEEIGVSERTPSIGPSQEGSVELLHCCTIVFGFHHCIVDGSSLMHFLGEFAEVLDALLQSVSVPMKQHPIYKSMTECMPRMSEREWGQWEAVHWSQPATTQSSPGVGVTKPISSVPLFSEILVMSEETLAIEYHVYIWQVSPQLSCGDICQIWMWFEESNMYFCHIENFTYGEINERSFSNPHPRLGRHWFHTHKACWSCAQNHWGYDNGYRH